MNRNDIRKIINEYLEKNKINRLSNEIALNIKKLLKANLPNEKYGNCYIIKSEYDDFFSEATIRGSIKRCDSFEVTNILDEVSFEINDNMEVMAWDNNMLDLTLNMESLSRDDQTDIKYINKKHLKIDIYKTFMRVKQEYRGKLAEMINNCLELFGDDIPPYAFNNYSGKFYFITNHFVGDLGGGSGFGGNIKELGTIAEIRAISIGDHAFDGCKNLTEVFLNDKVHFIGKNAFANMPNLIIHCPISAKPVSWDDEWCDSNCKVIWNN